MKKNLDEMILRFCRDDISGILITNESGEVLYQDEKSSFIVRDMANWKSACPPAYDGQKGETWDLMSTAAQKSYLVITSTVPVENELIQIHQLIDVSLYIEIYRDITNYSKSLKNEKDHDSLTGLFNKGKFMALKRSLFQDKDAIAIYNMDVNNLKYMNDTYGHEAGDKLIKKAAESLRRIEARNVMPFRVGGDEFIVVAMHVSLEEAEQLRRKWEAGLEEMNRMDDGIPCVIACGFAYGEKGYDLEALLARADQLMYEDKKRKKAFT